MKASTRRLKRLTIGGGIVFFAVLLSSCGMIGTTAGANMTVTVHASDSGPTYFSLESKTRVSDPAHNDWDIAFTYDKQILTDDGDSGIGGTEGGGVHFTGRTDFDSVESASGVNFSGSHDIDNSYWVVADGFTSSKRILNVMTFVGYNSGNGSQSSPYNGYNYGSKQYYVGHGLTIGAPSYTMTNNVYIIRHGDGVHYSKLQILGMEYDPSKRIYSIKTEPLN